jgi:hypothetical protein
VERTRKLIETGRLVGEQRGGRNQWFIDPQSLANEIAERGGPWETDVDRLAAEVRGLVGRVVALEGSDLAGSSGARTAAARDQYRAEASTMREVAIRANAAQRAAIAGFRQMLEAMDEQTNLVSELLGPRTPADFDAPGDGKRGD